MTERLNSNNINSGEGQEGLCHLNLLDLAGSKIHATVYLSIYIVGKVLREKFHL